MIIQKESMGCEIPIEIIEGFISICGNNFVRVNHGEKLKYSKDETIDYCFPFDVLIIPASTSEISDILKLCNKWQIPVTPRGGGSGVTGGALPVKRGVVLSLERLNKVIEINKEDDYAIVESGVITQTFCDQVEDLGMYFPVIPTSSNMSFTGGNVAENAGSIKSCKYGTTSDFILNLEVVLPNGEVIWTGRNVKKNVSGLNLTQLFVGSEGVLGVITKIVYRLIKKPKREVSFLLGFDSLRKACSMVLDLKSSEVSPSAVEFIGSEAIEMAKDFFDEDLPLTKSTINSHLLIQIEESDDDRITFYLETIFRLSKPHTKYDILVAQTSFEKDILWKIRMGLGAILTSNNGKYRDIDITVPVSNIYDYLKKIKDVASKYDIEIVRFGHVLDGNLHAMIRINKFGTEERVNSVIREIYSYAISRGGTISGEHGIGYVQKELMPMQFSSEYLNLLKKIKMVFDPKGILNPGKIF